MKKKLDRRTFLAKTAVFSGSALLGRCKFNQTAVAAGCPGFKGPIDDVGQK